jgi:hypothetical protein
MSGSRKPVSNPSIGLQIQARPEPARLMDGPRANPTWVAGGTWSRGRGGRCIGGLPGIWIWIPSLPLPGGWSCAGGLSTRRPDVPLCVCRCGGHGWLTGRSGVDGRWVCWAGLGSMLGCKFFFFLCAPAPLAIKLDSFRWAGWSVACRSSRRHLSLFRLLYLYVI